MLSCKESWRQKRRETSWVGVGVEERERSLALQPGQLRHIFQQKGSDISSSSLLFTTRQATTRGACLPGLRVRDPERGDVRAGRGESPANRQTPS